MPTAKLSDTVRGAVRVMGFADRQAGWVRSPREARGNAGVGASMILALSGVNQKKTQVQEQILPHKPQFSTYIFNLLLLSYEMHIYTKLSHHLKGEYMAGKVRTPRMLSM